MQVPMESSGEFATAGGMEQDIEMRGDRGDFEQGDYGNVGPGGGEMMDLGEYPWIQDALEDLKDEEFPNKEKAIQSLAGELGMSVKAMPADMDMNERKTITKKKFNNTLYELVLEEVVEAIDEQTRKIDLKPILTKELKNQLGIDDRVAGQLVLKTQESLDILSNAVSTLSGYRKKDPQILASKAVPAVVSNAISQFKRYKKRSDESNSEIIISFLNKQMDRASTKFLDSADKLKPKKKPRVDTELVTGDVPPHTTKYSLKGKVMTATVTTKDGKYTAQGQAKFRGNLHAAKESAAMTARVNLVRKVHGSKKSTRR